MDIIFIGISNSGYASKKKIVRTFICFCHEYQKTMNGTQFFRNPSLFNRHERFQSFLHRHKVIFKKKCCRKTNFLNFFKEALKETETDQYQI